MATRPYRFEYRIRHPPPLEEDMPAWLQPRVRFRPKIKPLQIILRSGSAAPDSTPPVPINTYSFHPLPGARWVLGIPRSISGNTISMEYRAPAARILCWDLAQVSQGDTDVLPVAWVDLAPRSDHMPEIQYDENSRTANILIITVPKQGYNCMSLVQLSWLDENPVLSLHSTSPPFAEQDEAALRLDGMHALFSSRAAPGLLWNWRDATWGRIPPEGPYLAFNACLRSPYFLRLRREGEALQFDIFAIPALYPCSETLRVIDAVRLATTPCSAEFRVEDYFSFWDAPNHWYPVSRSGQRCDLQFCYFRGYDFYPTLISIPLPPEVSTASSGLFNSGVGPEVTLERWSGHNSTASFEEFGYYDVLPSGTISRFPTFRNRTPQGVYMYKGKTRYQFYGDLIDTRIPMEVEEPGEVASPSLTSTMDILPEPGLDFSAAYKLHKIRQFTFDVSYSHPAPVSQTAMSRIYARFDPFSGKLVHIRTVPPQPGEAAFLDVFLNVYTIDV
ncbi:hypothetical protein DL93DRAFT_2227748 [Clavulina sp. PMI_390]|nr:hypothetical protein DL93DRAFT_2227748 [Clavulina sp. PMI_390]